MIIIPQNIICADKNRTILTSHAVEIQGRIIKKIFPSKLIPIDSTEEIIDAGGLTLIPGFIQTHVHLCQTLFRGLADDLPLLEWLTKKIFPFENAHDKNSLRLSAQLGLNELILSGTTTIMDMGTLRYQEVVFEELINSGIRAFAGKCMMDMNDLYPGFYSSTENELSYTKDLASSFHNYDSGRIKYGFAPRFALTSSSALMKSVKEMMNDYEGSIFHTHSSENINECKEIFKRFGLSNIDYFNSLGVLGSNTLLAHCIHLDDAEINRIKDGNTSISHCPSSNLKLDSGVADIPKFLQKGIRVSLGADGAPCNGSLSIFNEMRLASLIQKPKYGPEIMNAETIFRLATIDGAKALNIDVETGSIEEGKRADLVLIDLNTPIMPLNSMYPYSAIAYSASAGNIKYVMADGKWLIKEGKSLLFDQDALFFKGKEELSKILKRIVL